ncbi:MAG: autotransporter-associated beta strand repeat-containing protein [Verrucomicrobiota bacterium]|nr:autotransporter-associated beta strand repeat-containing protein [Verrucomicrobiota bacterium]
MKANSRRVFRVARVVFFLGCSGAVFAHSGWIHPFDPESWSVTRFVRSYRTSDAPRGNTDGESARRIASTTEHTVAAQQFARAIDDVIFGRDSFYPTTTRSPLSASVIEREPTAENDGVPVLSQPLPSFEKGGIAMNSGSAFTSSAPIPANAAPKPDPISPDVPVTAASWQGNGGTLITPTSGLWSADTNWTPGAPASTDTTVLSFGGSGATPYTSTNDLGTFTFQNINLQSTATVTETIAGQTLQIPTTGSGTITQNGSGAFEIHNDISANSLAANFYSTLHLAGSPTGGTGTVTLSGTLQDASANRRLALEKSGSNTVILTGANTYGGGTTVNTGTLLVNNTSGSGSGTGTGLVTVQGSGTLGGTGTITVVPVEGQAQVNVYSGGTIAPGNGPGQIGALTLNDTRTFFDAGSKLLIDLNGSLSDLLSTTGMMNIVSGATIDFNQLGPLTASSYQLATYSSYTGNFDPLRMPDGYALVYNPKELLLVAAPEPGTWAAAALAAAVMAFTCRRRYTARSALL